MSDQQGNGNGIKIGPSLQGAGISAQASMHLLVSLMDNIPDRIYFKDLESRFLLVNRAKVQACGVRTLEEVCGKTDFDFFSEEHARAARADEQRVIASGLPMVGQDEKETWQDGRVTWCCSTKMPLRDGEGRIIGTFGISRDVTEQHLAQEALAASEERYRQLLATVPTYTYSVQFDAGRPVHTNHGAGCQSVTGYLPREFDADPVLWIDMVHPEDRTAVLDYVEQAVSGERVTPIEHRIRHKDGSIRWIRSTIVRCRDSSGKVIRYDGLVEDITERKGAEAELQKTLGELERRVLQRTTALMETNKALQDELGERQRTEERLRVAMARLEEFDKAKMQFVFNISHELKTPLVSLRYAVENMLKGVTGPPSEKQTEYLVLMRRGIERLTHTLQEVLDLSRLEAHAMTLAPSQAVAADFVRLAIQPLAIVAEEKAVRLASFLDDIPERIEWDLDKMERVLFNLVENAIKFTPAGGLVEVAMKKDSERPDFVVLTVTDNGVGIAPRHLGHIMERYYRADESISGAGLGLSIGREIVRLHGGEISLACPPPGRETGTQVNVTLPLKAVRS
jgi:two-component system sensor histidine kinase/response regulator